ncbi:MAG: MerR family transcriptional regulator [Deltaproteobacteria bacterium]|nr:MerR family transcriptional regulator [Deltaproteobacteria bacterium]
MEIEGIPNKQYFKIGEVSALTQLEPYVLRYWETEFKMIRPVRFGSNQRMYRRKDVEIILAIKRLLYEEGFTIAGARKKLLQNSKEEKEKKALPKNDGTKNEVTDRMVPLMREIQKELTDLVQFLSK